MRLLRIDLLCVQIDIDPVQTDSEGRRASKGRVLCFKTPEPREVRFGLGETEKLKRKRYLPFRFLFKTSMLI